MTYSQFLRLNVIYSKNDHKSIIFKKKVDFWSF